MPQRARKTFFVGRRKVAKDELVADDDPVLTGRLHLFNEVDPFGQPIDGPQVEQRPDAEGGVRESGETVDGDTLPPAADELTDDEVREWARRLGIKRVGQKGRDRLIEEIAEAEAAGVEPASDDTESPPDPENTEPEES